MTSHQVLLAVDSSRNEFTGFSGVELLKRGEGPAGQRVEVPPVDDRLPAVALVDIPRQRDEWIPPQKLARSTSAGSGAITRNVSTLRRNRSAGNPVTPGPLSRGMSIAHGPFATRSTEAGRAPGTHCCSRACSTLSAPAAQVPSSLTAIYDTYIDGRPAQPRAATLAQASSGLGLTFSPARTPSRAPSLAASALRRRPTIQSAHYSSEPLHRHDGQ